MRAGVFDGSLFVITSHGRTGKATFRVSFKIIVLIDFFDLWGISVASLALL